MKSPIKLFLKIAISGWLLALIITATLAYVYEDRNVEKYYADSYIKDEFFKMNYITAVRHLLLKIGLDDDNILLASLENWQNKIYESGLKKIPEKDAEKLYWDYQFYLQPYEDVRLKREQIKDNQKRNEIALNIIEGYSKLEAKNKVLIDDAAFEQAANSFAFAMFKYPIAGLPSNDKISHIITSAWEDYQKYSKSYLISTDSVALNEKKIGNSTLFLMGLLDLSSHFIAQGWEELNLSCQDSLVKTFEEIEEKFPGLLQPMLEHMRAEGSATAEQIKDANYNRVTQYQPDAQKILLEKCNYEKN